MRLRYHDVKSSNLKAIAFEKGAAYVEFVSGRRFAYTMDRAAFDAFKASEKDSIGSYFARHIKSKCPVAWNGWRCSASPCAEDATVQTESAGVKFYLCPACSKLPIFTRAGLPPFKEIEP